MDKFYVTTAIAYPNGKPHMGHALEIIQADVVARFQKLIGKEVRFQTGTDEHGIKNWQTAKKEGKDIVQFLNDNVALFKDLYKLLNIEYDYFIRTTDKKIHHPGAIKLWNALLDSGDLYKKKYKGLYCSGCEMFKTEKELVDGKCPEHPTKKIEEVEEENYFFKLSKYAKEISKKIESDEYKVIPETRKNEILSFLKQAEDISFSRSKEALPHGIPVPDDDSQVMYVWCDALSNYATGAGYGRDDTEFNKWWPCNVHIIGKDILRFHAAYWPAMLLSAKVPLPKELLVHGFILSKGTKMGKSTGNVINPIEQINKYGVDPFRYYTLASMPLGDDGEYGEEQFVERINTELMGNFSNFCYRVISFTNKNYNSELKELDKDKVLDEIKLKCEEIKNSYEAYDFKRAIEGILAISDFGNQYFQSKEPWKNVDSSQSALGTCLNIARDLSILLQPIMPSLASNLQKQLNIKSQSWKDLGTELSNHKINNAEMLLQKVEFVAKAESVPLDLRVAKVKEVKDHPEADKLLILKIDLGTEERQLVAGLKEYYPGEELKGKKVVVVCNLKPAKLRGVESQGMLLAGEDKENVGVLTVDVKLGTKVEFKDCTHTSDQIEFDEFKKLKIKVKDSKIFLNGNQLLADGKEVTAEKVKTGNVH